MRSSFILLLYASTLFTSAFLLFVLQPMVGKLLLPLYGGTPAVWNVCLVFFQTMLLLGYLYANRLSRFRYSHLQFFLHFSIFAAAGYFLQKPLSAHSEFSHPSMTEPVSTLLVILIKFLGIPFLWLSATSSLLQNWFSQSEHPSANDPYFLFAASNFGSLTALLLYPLGIEPFFTLSTQFLVWKQGYWVLGGLILLCAISWKRWPGKKELSLSIPLSRVSWKTRMRWIMLSFVPSSLLIGATTYLSTDIAAVPLLWIIPLLLYLVSFIAAFSRMTKLLGVTQVFWLGRMVAFGSCVAVLGIILESNHPAWLFFPLHLILFFLICLLCNLRLAQSRPPVDRLTEFYFWISLGGALGGIFNTLLAPHLFTMVAEYPLIILIGTLFRERDPKQEDPREDLLMDVVIGLLAAATVFTLNKVVLAAGLGTGKGINLLVLGLPMLLAYRFVNRPRRYALAVLAIYASSLFFFSGRGNELVYRERTFYGINKVERDSEGKFQLFYHGSTLHGQQFLDPAKRSEPLAYFSRESPIAQVFEMARSGHPDKISNLAIVGLGVGTMAAYAQKGEAWTFYEIDPGVLRLARDSGYFTFLKESASHVENRFILGDARLRLKEAPDGEFDVLILDAFTSDSIPVHLMTREAVSLYWQKLKPDGILVFNVSNRYFDLAPTLSALAKDSGASAFLAEHDISEAQSNATGIAPSSWIAMVKQPENWAKISKNRRWLRLEPDNSRVWTDDFSNILSLLRTKF
jgi:spermidine synthase